MNHDPTVCDPQQCDIPPEVNAERPKRKRHDHNIVGNLTPPSCIPVVSTESFDFAVTSNLIGASAPLIGGRRRDAATTVTT